MAKTQEPSSPLEKVWKPELYKIQLEAPTPIKLLRDTDLTAQSTETPYSSLKEYHGEISHREAEQLLNDKCDGTYLIRKSPPKSEKPVDYYTLSVKFNKRTKHFKIYFKEGKGHFLQEQAKHYESIHDLVQDGLLNFYMELHAAPIIQQINQQTRNCYQQSPYMTLNRRKLRALSHELRKSLVSSTVNTSASITKANLISDSLASNIDEENKNINGNSLKPKSSSDLLSNADDSVDTILPSVYEKQHAFKLHTFKGLFWCEFCGNFLWGLTSQGKKCDSCGFVAHVKCSELVPNKCVPQIKKIRGVFGTDLTTVTTIYQCSIPFVVRRCVEEIEARGMLQEGIYRVSGFADEIEALKLALDRDGEKADMSETAYGNVNVIAGTLKSYLRLLPIPLITFQAYPSFMEATKPSSTAEQIKGLQEAAKKLPPSHYECLKFMMEHLKKVASHYAVNKMNEHNLATVFAPTLIATPQHMTTLTEEIFMLSALIANCKSIFN